MNRTLTKQRKRIISFIVLLHIIFFVLPIKEIYASTTAAGVAQGTSAAVNVGNTANQIGSSIPTTSVGVQQSVGANNNQSSNFMCKNDDVGKLLIGTLVNFSSVPPIYVGGIKLVDNKDIDSVLEVVDTIGAKSFMAKCGGKFCVPILMYEPDRIVTKVKKGFCFYAFNVDKGDELDFLMGVGQKALEAMKYLLAQEHIKWHWQMVVNGFLGLLQVAMDVVCLRALPIDIVVISAIDPTINKDTTFCLIKPFCILFANLPVVIACAPVTIMQQIGVLFATRYAIWCSASRGDLFPSTVNFKKESDKDTNAQVIQRMLFGAASNLQLWDGAVNVCFAVPTIICLCDHYKAHVALPLRQALTQNIFQWEQFKMWLQNLHAYIFKGENHAWILFRKKACCIGRI